MKKTLLQTIIYGCLSDSLAIKALFSVEKKAENKYLPFHNLPAMDLQCISRWHFVWPINSGHGY